MYNLIIKKSARRELDNIPNPFFLKIDEAVLALKDNPYTNFVSQTKAHYEILPDNEGYFGKIEGLQGIWANADSLEACREELREVLEEWFSPNQ